MKVTAAATALGKKGLLLFGAVLAVVLCFCLSRSLGCADFFSRVGGDEGAESESISVSES